MPTNVVPADQPNFGRSVKIGEWSYPVNEQGQPLTFCPLCNETLPAFGATPGHVCGKMWMTEQEFLEARAEEERQVRVAKNVKGSH